MTPPPITTLPDDKLALRRAVRRARMALPPSQRRRAEQQIARLAARFLRRGKRIGGYLASGSELDIEALLGRALQRGATVYLPVIPDKGRRLWFSRLGPDDRWYRHPRYPITEYAGPVLRAERLDVLFVPLLAVDQDGYRLGQGGGFYDTTLHAAGRQRPLLVGVAFDCQRVARVPREAWDIRLDWLVTEAGIFRFGPAMTNVCAVTANSRTMQADLQP
ncbi:MULTISPECIES: 5-formyltetrahydrofolate cyclo-ligase [unclassified Paludibacterium]|uniref:5-formyltetrahydrofolate cyclo-ligase n=1 Tax=unclassified Paludibacterium TaxID=2618429 RepID=UPI001C059D57|nr:5-formyltetrahydrofolate cyclo-ligase [Paludibacterium sp. B53371]BEV72853.1 5-formyltetrahydrofolate cyclo-ligase [Paludibacterium sp. THUN1379]